jgi:hypothetical protein
MEKPSFADIVRKKNCDQKNIIYKNGTFGNCEFLDGYPILNNKEDYNDIIIALWQKTEEISQWIYEDDTDGNINHINRIKNIEKYIEKLKKISNDI